MLPWQTIIQLDRGGQCAVYLQIVNAVVKEISQGRLQPGQKLPGSRRMAEILAVNRKTAALAYEELMAQGWIDINPSSGSYVAESLPVTSVKPLQKSEPTEPVQPKLNIPYNLRIQSYSPPPANKFIIDDGSPDPRIAPMNSLMKHCRSIVKTYYGRRLLSYNDVKGEATLRAVLSKYLLETRGLSCHPENIVITRGSQMAIYLFFNALIEKGDKVIVTQPNYTSANWVIQHAGGQLVEIPVDREGIMVDEVEKYCVKHPVKAAYITPHHHFPTTVALSAQRRLQLLALAEKHGFFILEDDYDYDFQYGGAPVLPLASVDNSGLVIYSGSFSKLLAPSVRVGYLVAPEPQVSEIAKLRRIVDRQGDTIMERAIADMLSEGEIQRHLKKAVKIYRQRRDLFCGILREKLSEQLEFDVPEGGMAVWTKFKSPIREVDLFDKLLKKGLYLNVDRYFLDDWQAVRLGFAALNETEMQAALRIWADAF